MRGLWSHHPASHLINAFSELECTGGAAGWGTTSPVLPLPQCSPFPCLTHPLRHLWPGCTGCSLEGAAVVVRVAG